MFGKQKENSRAGGTYVRVRTFLRRRAQFKLADLWRCLPRYVLGQSSSVAYGAGAEVAGFERRFSPLHCLLDRVSAVIG
jgi:hypothetical protein